MMTIGSFFKSASGSAASYPQVSSEKYSTAATQTAQVNSEKDSTAAIQTTVHFLL